MDRSWIFHQNFDQQVLVTIVPPVKVSNIPVYKVTPGELQMRAISLMKLL